MPRPKTWNIPVRSRRETWGYEKYAWVIGYPKIKSIKNEKNIFETTNQNNQIHNIRLKKMTRKNMFETSNQIQSHEHGGTCICIGVSFRSNCSVRVSLPRPHFTRPPGSLVLPDGEKHRRFWSNGSMCDIGPSYSLPSGKLSHNYGKSQLFTTFNG